MINIHSFCFNPFQENTYVLYNDQKHCIIVDAGCYFEEEKNQLLHFIQQNDLQPVLLLNSHAHLDHVFGLNFLKEKICKHSIYIARKRNTRFAFSTCS